MRENYLNKRLINCQKVEKCLYSNYGMIVAKKVGIMINLEIEVFSSHEIIDNYYSLYVNCCEEIDGHKFFCQIKQNH